MAIGGGLNYWGDVSIAPAAARTTDTTGTAVDTKGFEEVFVVVTSGTITDGTHNFWMEESDDNSTFTTVDYLNLDLAATGVSGSDYGCLFDTTSAHDSAVQIFGYKGGKRYVKVRCTVAGSPSTGGVYCATVVCTRPRHAPVATP
jgi:hypothetical protein